MQLPGAVLPWEHIHNAALRNPDGFGYAFSNGKRPVTIRRFLEWERMAESYYRDNLRHPESVFIIHFRLATHGTPKISNSHPFRFKNGAMIHNGVFNLAGLPGGMSDSKFLTRRIIDNLPEGWEDEFHWTDFVQRAIGSGNKLAFLFTGNKYLIINEKAGHWDKAKKLWFSNSSYEAAKVGGYRAPGGGGRSYVAREPEQSWSEWLDEFYKDHATPACEVIETDPVEMSDGKVIYLPRKDESRPPTDDYCFNCWEEFIPGVDHECSVEKFLLGETRRRVVYEI